MTWDRGFQTEYFTALSDDLNTWGFPDSRYILSMDAAPSWTYTITGVPGPRFFSRTTQIDYSQVPAAPADFVANGKQVTIQMSAGEQVTLTFDGAGGGSWAHSGGDSGTLSNVTWVDPLPLTGVFGSVQPLSRLIPLGRIAATFDHPVGSEQWYSFVLPLCFHTPTSGWCDGTAEVPQFPPIPGGASTMTETKRVSFVYTP